MNEQIWRDRATGVRFHCSPAWIRMIHERIGDQLAKVLGEAAICENETAWYQAAANRAAGYWRQSYYQQLFPLKFRLVRTPTGAYAEEWLPASADVWLTADASSGASEGAGGSHAPPILPAPGLAETEWLLADRLLIEAACCGVILGRFSHHVQQATRLAALTYPFHYRLRHLPMLQGAVAQIGAIFQAQADGQALHQRIQAVVNALWEGVPLAESDLQVGLVRFATGDGQPLAADGWLHARRSAALSQGLMQTLRTEIDLALGPEVVLHAAEAGLLFLAPADRHLSRRAQELTWRFFAQTGNAGGRGYAERLSLREVCEDVVEIV